MSSQVKELKQVTVVMTLAVLMLTLIAVNKDTHLMKARERADHLDAQLVEAEANQAPDCQEDEVLHRKQVPGPWTCINTEEFVAGVICESPARWYVEPSACRG